MVNTIRAGRIEGAPGALKLLNIFENDEGSQVVGLTVVGLQFASLKNPILDEGTFESSLSREESIFYMKKIIENLSREKELNISVLKAINDGKSSPSELNEAICYLSRGWSEAMVNTIRAGAISRQNELGLIKRSKKGVLVNYALTQLGRDILSNYTAEHGGN
jgi:hypothetical protein